jgi:pyruvate dehydrogenase E2 component (dihydrolipoamide acetyltransferase)
MAIDVILPALGMSQDTGKIVRWLKAEGEQVAQGQPLAEIETDKATVEIEAPADGVLTGIRAAEGDDVPVGQVIAAILTAEEASSRQPEQATNAMRLPTITVSPLAARIAAEHRLDLNLIKPVGRRVQKADVLAYLQNQKQAVSPHAVARLIMASPKARRLAAEQGKDLAAISGSGPEGAVLAADVLAAAPAPRVSAQAPGMPEETPAAVSASDGLAADKTVSTVWRIMAERTAQSWMSVPHFYLVREVNASRLLSWRELVLKRSSEKITYTDLLVKIVAASLRMHPRLNVSWRDGKIALEQQIHIGLAVAVEDGLVVPVIHEADKLNLDEIARQRAALVAKAQAGKLRPQDIQDGTFTISNLGMYNVDAFNAIINQPQAAILAVGRIAERVVPVHGQPTVQPTMILTLSCDHRATDGARGAQFLATLAEFIEEPLGLLN